MSSAFAGASILAEQRVAPRAVFHRKGSFTDSKGTVIPVKVVDISTTGVGLLSPYPFDFELNCIVRAPTYHPDLPEISLKGKVVYSILSGMQGFRVGVQFSEMEPKVKSFIDRIIAVAP